MRDPAQPKAHHMRLLRRRGSWSCACTCRHSIKRYAHHPILYDYSLTVFTELHETTIAVILQVPGPSWCRFAIAETPSAESTVARATRLRPSNVGSLQPARRADAEEARTDIRSFPWHWQGSGLVETSIRGDAWPSSLPDGLCQLGADGFSGPTHK